jgi:DNA invertase Pin-like site-specific DNA recombinase
VQPLHNDAVVGVAYTRVSTEDQSRGLSLQSQRQACFAYASRRSWTVLDVVEEHASGKALTGRPVLSETLQALSNGKYSALIVSRFDRLTRKTRDFYDRAKNEGWALVCLEPELDMTTPHGRAFAGVIAIFAEFERELISQRQKESVAARRAAGTYKPPQPMASPFVVARIRQLRIQGLSGDAIADRLTAEGFPGLRADAWNGRTVRKILQRERIGTPDR